MLANSCLGRTGDRSPAHEPATWPPGVRSNYRPPSVPRLPAKLRRHDGSEREKARNEPYRARSTVICDFQPIVPRYVPAVPTPRKSANSSMQPTVSPGTTGPQKAVAQTASFGAYRTGTFTKGAKNRYGSISCHCLRQRKSARLQPTCVSIAKISFVRPQLRQQLGRLLLKAPATLRKSSIDARLCVAAKRLNRTGEDVGRIALADRGISCCWQTQPTAARMPMLAR
jgi:hypothetical protein